MILFCAQDVLQQTSSKLGYLLLRCIRYYIELDMYASMEVHTEDTIAAGRQALQDFSDLMDVCIILSPKTLCYSLTLATTIPLEIYC